MGSTISSRAKVRANAALTGEKRGTMLVNVRSRPKVRARAKESPTTDFATIVGRQATSLRIVPVHQNAKGKGKRRKDPTMEARHLGRSPATA